MSVLGKLIGVSCWKCRNAGHFCQAQILMDGLPWCMRCADGEACCYETAAQMPTPERMIEDSDPCELPALKVEDRKFFNSGKQFAPVEAGTKKAALADLECMKVCDVAEKYGLSIKVVNGLKAAVQREQQLRGECATAYADSLRRATVPVQMNVGGEMVRMAPNASMGSELLGLGTADPSRTLRMTGKRPEIGAVMGALANYFRVDVDELCHIGPGRVWEARRRAIAITIVARVTGLKGVQIAEKFGITQSRVSLAKRMVKKRSGLERDAQVVLGSLGFN